ANSITDKVLEIGSGFVNDAKQNMQKSVLFRGATNPNLENPNLFDTFMGGVHRSATDQVNTMGQNMGLAGENLGDVAEYFGFTNLANDIRAQGERGYQTYKQLATDTSKGFEEKPRDHEFRFTDLLDPEYMAAQAGRMLPTTAGMATSFLQGQQLMAPLKTLNVINKSRFGKVALDAVGAGGISAALEASMEAGNVYEDARNKGMSVDDAQKAANQTF